MPQDPPALNVSAPGKLVLLGEYAVLEGVAAWSLAIDRRARVGIHHRSSPTHRLTSTLFPDRELAFTVDDGRRLTWSIGNDNTFRTGIEHLLKPWLGKLAASADGLSIRLDTAAFFETLNDRPEKLGFGSSAALTVAFHTAMAALCQSDTQESSLAAQIAAHRQQQGGVGSGIDIATSLSGGLIRFQREPEGIAVVPATLPEDFHWLAVWSGSSASTGDMLRQIRRWSRSNPENWQRLLQQAAVIGSDAERSVRQNHTQDLLQAIARYGRWMQTLGRRSGTPIYNAAHRHLDTIAAAQQCAYKPSGAGGGDIGFAAAAELETLNGFRQAAESAGYRIIALSEDKKGPVFH